MAKRWKGSVTRNALASVAVLALVVGGCGSDGDPEPVDLTPPRSTNGIVWQDGRLWIASLFGSQLVQVDPRTGELTRGYGPDDGLVQNDDLVILGDGSFVVTETFDGTVSRFHPKRGRTLLAEIGSSANGIALCADGRVFVNRETAGGGVFEIDPKGIDRVRLVTDDVPALNSMACIGDDLYAPTFALAGGVVRIDRESGAVSTVASGLVLPAAVHTGPDGRLFALQSVFPGRVVEVDPTGGGWTERARFGGMIPDNFTVGPDGTFYVTDFLDAAVLAIHPDATTHRFEL